MVIKKKYRQKLIKIHPKKHQIAPFKFFSRGSMRPNSPSMSLRDMQVHTFENKILAPPPKSWDAPALY